MFCGGLCILRISIAEHIQLPWKAEAVSICNSRVEVGIDREKSCAEYLKGSFTERFMKQVVFADKNPFTSRLKCYN